jgi:hypothetical protein
MHDPSYKKNTVLLLASLFDYLVSAVRNYALRTAKQYDNTELIILLTTVSKSRLRSVWFLSLLVSS